MDLKLLNQLKLRKDLALELRTVIQTVLLLSFLSFLNISCSPKKQIDKNPYFSFNLPRDVHSVDPLLIRGTAKRFILFNLHRGLYYYDKDNKLSAHGAKSCAWQNKLKIKCSLNPKKWSDGSLITARHYLNTISVIKEQKEESLELLSDIKGIYSEDGSLVFILKKENKDFLHDLTSPYFNPRKEARLYKSTAGQVFSGPYKVHKKNRKYIILKNNNFYDAVQRPSLKAIFIDDPSAALNMYLSGGLDFLRYLETSSIPKYPNRLMAPFIRLDGIFFNLSFLKDENLRKAFFYSLDFKALQKIFYSPSKPGCISLPDSFFKTSVPCYSLDLAKAKSFYKKVVKKPKSFKLHIPSISSDEHKKLAQWAKENWRKNLGLDVKIEQMEPGVFYENIRRGNLEIYRKSVSLKNLTCKEAMENVRTQPEFKDVEFTKGLTCDEFFKSILKQHIWLPLGLPSFAHLHAKDYSGYYINMLGQFGLESLQRKSTNQTTIDQLKEHAHD